MKKIIVFLMIVSLIFMGIGLDVFAAFTAVNIGPTTDLNGDINVPSAKGYYINSVLFSTAGLIDISTLAVTDNNVIVGNGSNWVAESGATLLTSIGLGNITNILNKLDGTAAPVLATDDITLGYTVGSRWFDVTNDKEYVCLDNTDGAAVWTETTSGLTYTGDTEIVETGTVLSIGSAITRDTELQAVNHIEHFMDVDAAAPAYVHAAIVGTGVAQDVSTVITNPDFGRNITVTSTAGSVGVVTITGTTANGTTGATDAITIIDGTIAYGVKAFVTVTNINVSAALISPEEVTIGIGDLIGLANSISAEADIYSKTVDGVNEFDEISGKGNTTNGTLDCATIVQNEDITIYYHN